MSKKRKILIISFVVIIIVLAASYCGFTYVKELKAKEPKSLTEFYFNKDSRKYIEDLVYQDNQEVTVDDYTFSLEEVLVEDSVPTVYCKFAVSREGQDMTKEWFIDKGDFFGGSGVDMEGRFWFYMAYDEHMTQAEFKYMATKDVLYVYGKFLLQPYHNDSAITVYLYDSNSGKTDEKMAENSCGKFILKKAYKAKTYYYKDEEIVINPFRFSITSNIGIFCGKLEIYYKDKTKMLIKENDSYGSMVAESPCGTVGENPYGSGYSNESYMDIVFKNPIDVENIDYICVSGNRLD